MYLPIFASVVIIHVVSHHSLPFSPSPSLSRNLQKDLSAQGYRCTGCGMKVNPTLAKYFRFCNYTGKYFCQNCHTNATSIIPAYILERWSFKRLYVSNFARDLLAKINKEPVFTITNANSTIYSKVPIMAAAKVSVDHVTSHVIHLVHHASFDS